MRTDEVWVRHKSAHSTHNSQTIYTPSTNIRFLLTHTDSFCLYLANTATSVGSLQHILSLVHRKVLFCLFKLQENKQKTRSLSRLEPRATFALSLTYTNHEHEANDRQSLFRCLLASNTILSKFIGATTMMTWYGKWLKWMKITLIFLIWFYSNNMQLQ